MHRPVRPKGIGGATLRYLDPLRFASIVKGVMFKSFSRWLLRASLLSLLSLVLNPAWAGSDDTYLEPTAAFKFSARMRDAGTVAVTYDIADGYYMYRERFRFSARGATLDAPQIPAGIIKFDTTFNKNEETYRKAVTILIPVHGSSRFTLIAVGQGCSDKGLCYSPLESRQDLAAGAASADGAGAPLGATPAADVPANANANANTNTNTNTGAPGLLAPAPAAANFSPAPNTAPAASALTPQPPAGAQAEPSATGDMGRIQAALQGGKLLVIAPMFILFGLVLSFTPCVLPMVPILSSIIVGEGDQVTRARSFLLSLTYVLGMALVYTALGVVAGLLGEGLAASLQNPWVLGCFGLLMAGLSLSMFGFYELQVPAALQSKLAGLSNRQSSGKLAGVFVMGAISALIVGPCVAGPLAGVLVYISQTRDAVVGGSALFSLALGMGVPLLLVGASAGWLLPRAGAWMEAIKRFFGVMLLATAWWLVSPVLPGALQMAGWTVLGVGYGMYLLGDTRHWAARALGLLFAVLGVVQLVGLVSGSRDALAPLARLQGGATAQSQALAFTRVKTVAQLDAALAGTGGRTALLDFYADWCVSCKEMEKLTFITPQVKSRLADTVLLQVDVTANDADDQALLKRFKLFGPPGIILFDKGGREISDARVIGYQDAPAFLASLSRLQ
jgi:thiol:disulfide interchange protein DsbD